MINLIAEKRTLGPLTFLSRISVLPPLFFYFSIRTILSVTKLKSTFSK